MRCAYCRGRASIMLPYARMALCNRHFPDYIVGRVAKTIERYRLFGRGDRVLLGISGGKDSVALASILSRLRGDVGYKVHCLHIDLGIPGYSEESRGVVLEVSRRLGAPLSIISLRESIGVGIPELASATGREPCSICGTVKRYILNAAASKWGVDVVATGHNLDDLTTYMLKSLLRGDYEAAAKLSPKSERVGGLVSRVRPLAEVSEEEAKLYVVVEGLPHVARECPLAPTESFDLEIRRFLNLLEKRHPSTKIGFYRASVRRLKRAEDLEVRGCSVCGMPASGDTCGFCKAIIRSVGEAEPIKRLHETIESLEVEFS